MVCGRRSLLALCAVVVLPKVNVLCAHKHTTHQQMLLAPPPPTTTSGIERCCIAMEATRRNSLRRPATAELTINDDGMGLDTAQRRGLGYELCAGFGRRLERQRFFCAQRALNCRQQRGQLEFAEFDETTKWVAQT